MKEYLVSQKFQAEKTCEPIILQRHWTEVYLVIDDHINPNEILGFAVFFAVLCLCLWLGILGLRVFVFVRFALLHPT